MIQIPFKGLLSPWPVGSVKQQGGGRLDWLICALDGKPWQNNRVELRHSRGICILMDSALPQKQTGKPWVVVNSP